MIISHAHKFIFLKNPKAASSAINNAFRLSGLTIEYARAFTNTSPIGPMWSLGFDTQAILDMGFATQTNFEDYDLYGVYRDPVEVFMSWYTYNIRYANANLSGFYPRAINAKPRLQRYMTNEDRQVINSITPRMLLEEDKLRPEKQTHYLSNRRINIIDYNNLSNDIPAIIKKYGGTFVDMPVINTFKRSNDVIDSELSNDIKKVYAIDYLLKDRIVAVDK